MLFDAVLVAGGALSVSELLTEQKVLDFVKEAYQHFKPIAAIAEGMNLLPAASGEGIVVAQENEDRSCSAKPSLMRLRPIAIGPEPSERNCP